eukprot:781012-Amphidinium_carterae.1
MNVDILLATPAGFVSPSPKLLWQSAVSDFTDSEIAWMGHCGSTLVAVKQNAVSDFLDSVQTQS